MTTATTNTHSMNTVMIRRNAGIVTTVDNLYRQLKS
jgi:hypothetical protein